MSIETWIGSWFDDRQAFETTKLKLPDDQADALRMAVDFVLTELHVVQDWHTAERVDAVRGEPAAEPDLLALSRVGEALKLLIAKAVRDQRVEQDLFDDLVAATIDRIARLKRYHGHILMAVMTANCVEKQGLQIRTLSEAEGDAMLGVVADAAYRWPGVDLRRRPVRACRVEAPGDRQGAASHRLQVARSADAGGEESRICSHGAMSTTPAAWEF